MEERVQSRLLNDKRFALGLSLKDFVIVMVLFLILARTLEDTAYGGVAFLIAALFGACFIPLRSRHRHGVIRDYVCDSVSKWIRRK